MKEIIKVKSGLTNTVIREYLHHILKGIGKLFDIIDFFWLLLPERTVWLCLVCAIMKDLKHDNGFCPWGAQIFALHRILCKHWLLLLSRFRKIASTIRNELDIQLGEKFTSFLPYYQVMWPLTICTLFFAPVL